MANNHILSILPSFHPLPDLASLHSRLAFPPGYTARLVTFDKLPTSTAQAATVSQHGRELPSAQPDTPIKSSLPMCDMYVEESNAARSAAQNAVHIQAASAADIEDICDGQSWRPEATERPQG